MSRRSKKLSALVLVLLAACAAEQVDQRNSRIGQGGGGGGGGGTGGGGPGGISCSDVLAIDCDPDEKQYTPEEIAQCEASRQKDYDYCVADALCSAPRVPAEQACYSPDGTKPAEGTPERAVFDACYEAAWEAYYSCMASHGAGGGGTGGGPGGG
jgi:hypothetical protein